MVLNAHHDDDPEGYDAIRRGWLNRRRTEHFCDRVEQLAPRTVVEMGSGTGRMLVDLAAVHPDVRFIGVEPLAEYVRFGQELIAGQELPNIELRCGTGEGLDEILSGESADLVISSDVLHHVADVGRVVHSVRALLRAGGHWSIVEPNAGNPYVGLFQAFTSGERNFWPRSFIREARRAGFEVLGRSRMFLIPSTIEDPPGWMTRLEAVIERAPVAGGAVRLELRRT